MKIAGINADINVIPVQELVQLMKNIDAAKTFNEMSHAAVAAKSYLQCLIQTQYISKREHYEFQRQLNDECNRKESEIKQYEHS